MNISVHRITSISIDDPDQLSPGSWVRHIVIKSTCNGIVHDDEICLFADTEEALLIGGMV